MDKLLMITSVVVLIFSFHFIANLFFVKIISNKVSKRKETIFVLIINLIKYLGLIVGIFVILAAFKVDTASVLAGAGVLGILLGFGLQKLIQDMINGFFIIFENQYVVGEYVTINGATGEVVELGLKTTKVLTYKGEMYFFANGDINVVVNHSRINSLVVIDFPILHKYSYLEVKKLIESVINKIIHHNIINEPRILGIQGIDEITYKIRIVCATQPFTQFEITRLINTEILKVLEENGYEYLNNYVVKK